MHLHYLTANIRLPLSSSAEYGSRRLIFHLRGKAGGGGEHAGLGTRLRCHHTSANQIRALRRTGQTNETKTGFRFTPASLDAGRAGRTPRIIHIKQKAHQCEGFAYKLLCVTLKSPSSLNSAISWPASGIRPIASLLRWGWRGVVVIGS